MGIPYCAIEKDHGRCQVQYRSEGLIREVKKMECKRECVGHKFSNLFGSVIALNCLNKRRSTYITYIFPSPMRRTLSTSYLALWPLLERGLQKCASLELQTLDLGLSGTGTSLQSFEEECPRTHRLSHWYSLK